MYVRKYEMSPNKKSKCHKAKKAQKLYEKKEKMSTTFKVKKKM